MKALIDRKMQKRRSKLYAIRRHYTIVKSVPQEQAFSTKPTQHLLNLPAADSVAAVDAYVCWLENEMENGHHSMSEKKKLEFELAIAHQFLENLKKKAGLPVPDH